MTSTASLRSSRHGAKCAQCGAKITAPDWSERAGPRETVHLWRCWCCGNEFETLDHHPTTAAPTAELVEEFLPNLLVG